MIDVTAIVERAVARADADAVIVGVSVDEESNVIARGVWPDGAPASAESVFYAASLTKQLIGLLVAMSAERGEVDVHDSARRWLPSLPPWAANVTVEDLLHHIAGLPLQLQPGGRQRTTDSVLAAAQRMGSLGAAPRTRFQYSNDGYVLLALVLESATGIPVQELAERRIFFPLDMRSSSLRRTPLIRVANEPAPPATIGDGGWWTSTHDVIRLLNALNVGRFDPAALRVTQTSALISGEVIEYAWGVRLIDIEGVATVSHGGSWERWQSKTLRLPALNLEIAVAARASTAQAVSDLAKEVAVQVIRAR